MRRVWIPLVVCAALILAACGGGDEDGGQADQPEPTATPARTALPPTWTPSPEGFQPSVTPTPEEFEALQDAESAVQADAPGGIGTPLPPTWTPFVRPSVTPRFYAQISQTPPTASPPPPEWPTPTPLSEACYDLEPLMDDDPRAAVGEPVGLRWEPIEGIPTYEVNVYHPNGNLVFSATTESTLLEVPAEYFNAPGAYGWEIEPLQDGQPVCFPISGEIIMTAP